ncbi:MAG: peptidoglycan DD-metalloendopeptidase family protein [Myxococcaceae bacterium]
MSFPVSQTHNIGSHVGNDAWAWDFRMPEGTPVVAALDGVVRLARGDSEEGGCDPSMARKANYVVLEHAGNLETQYLHFTTVSVVVGQHVRRGDLLGYSGKTGWACGAHLHFKVATPVSAGWNNPSLESRLVGFGDPELEVWISSPPCTAPLEVATQRPVEAPRPAEAEVETPGAVQPAALSTRPGSAQPGLEPGAPASDQRAAGGALAANAGPERATPPPVAQHPLSAGGSPLTAPSRSATPASPLGPGLPATSSSPPALVARPPLGMPAAAPAVRDTEAELLDGADVARPGR